MAAGHAATVEAGTSILSAGGNAVDAACAAVFASCVSETMMTGLGGGGFATVFHAGTKTVTCHDFFVAVPGIGASRASSALEPIEVAFGGVPLEFSIGAASVAVPGVVAGCEALLTRFGTLPWRDILAPAVGLAREGVTVSGKHAEALQSVAPALLPGDGAAAYAPGGQLLRAGQRLYHPGLEHSLQQLADEGAAAMYRGDMADAIVASVAERGGVLSRADLEQYRVANRVARYAHFGADTVWGRDDLSHTVDVLDGLNRVWPRQRSWTAAQRAVPVAQALDTKPDHSLGDTTNVSVIDSAGNACVITTTLGIGSGIWPAGTGIHLNSMMGEGELRFGEGVPGERMASMMCPLVVRDRAGDVAVALGSAGASRIRTALTHTLLRICVDRDTAATAIAGGRFHPVGGTVHCEDTVESGAVEALDAAGYRVVEWRDDLHYFGGVSAVCADSAAGDPRRDGTGTHIVG